MRYTWLHWRDVQTCLNRTSNILRRQSINLPRSPLATMPCTYLRCPPFFGRGRPAIKPLERTIEEEFRLYVQPRTILLSGRRKGSPTCEPQRTITVPVVNLPTPITECWESLKFERHPMLLSAAKPHLSATTKGAEPRPSSSFSPVPPYLVCCLFFHT